MYGHVVGRESELAAVEVFLDSIEEGFSALVLEGEPGIGKDDGVAGRCRAGGAAGLSDARLPAGAGRGEALLRGPLGSARAGAAGGVRRPSGAGVAGARDRLAAGAGSRFTPEPRATAAGVRGPLAGLAGDAPVLVAIDDAQWIDSASAGALGFALRRLDGARASVRSPPGDPRRPGASSFPSPGSWCSNG